MTKEKTKEEKSVVGRTFHHFWQEIKRGKVLYAIGFVTQVAEQAVGYLITLRIADIINRITAGDIPTDRLFDEFAPLIAVVAGMLLLNRLVLNRINMWAVWKAEVRSIVSLSKMCFNVISNQTMHFHNNKFGGSLVSQVGKFVHAFERLMDDLNWNIIPTIMSITMIAIILGPLMPEYVIILFGLSIVFGVFAYWSFRSVRKLNEQEATAQNVVSGQLADSLTNIMTVKSYAGEDSEQKLYTDKNIDYQEKSMALMRAINVRSIVFGTITTVMWIVLVSFLVGEIGMGAIAIGTIVMSVSFTGDMIGKMWQFNNILQNFYRVVGDSHDMTKILDEENVVVDLPVAKPLKITEGAVDFNEISFKHIDGSEAVFEGLDLHIEPGQRIGLVGRSGSGKTTLTKLLLRFADAQQGTITIDGQNISEVTQQSLRNNIAYVPQETTLFHRAISENISYGRPNAKKAEVVKAAQLANAWEFIKDLPDGMDTLTGERGVKLSGGQRQRVAIARAILKDAPILVLDEATASLDTESEKLIQEALSRLMRGRTSIVVAHRLSTVAEMDRIIVLDNGKIIEDDTHENLVKKGGVYAKLWNKQTGTMK